MKINEMFNSVVESVKNVDKMKLLGTVATGLGIAASFISNSVEKKEREAEIEKVVEKLLKKDGGVQ